MASTDRTSKLLEGLSEPERAKQLKVIERHRESARPGQRIAVVCPHAECNPRWRQFFSSEEQARSARCPDHGQAVRQENRPYFGVPTA